MDIRTEHNEYKAGRLKIEQLSSACLLESINMKNRQIKGLTDKVKDLEFKFTCFDLRPPPILNVAPLHIVMIVVEQLKKK